MNLLLLALVASPVFAIGHRSGAPSPRPAPPTPTTLAASALLKPLAPHGAVAITVRQDGVATGHIVGFPDMKAFAAARAAGLTPKSAGGLPVLYQAAGEAIPAAAPGTQKDGAAAAAEASRVFDGTVPMLKPAVESWGVEGRDYASTAELTAAMRGLDKPVNAAYSFAHSAVPEPKARGVNTLVGAAAGGVIGSVGGVVLAAVAGALGPLMELFLFGSMSRGGTAEDMAIIAAFLGGFSALAGAVIAWEETRRPAAFYKTVIRGRLFRQAGENGGTLYFEPKTDGKALVVNVDKYAEAAPLQQPAAPKPWPDWKRAGMGAAWGLALAVSQWIPLVQIFALPVAGPYAGATIGQALSHGKGVAGGVLGGALGLAVPVLAFASFAAVQTSGFLVAFGAFAGLLMVLGALIGLLAADAVRAHAARESAQSPAGQWWVAASGGR